MRNRLLICVTVALLASGSFALAQGATGSPSTDQKSAAPKAGAAKQAQTPAQDKAKASSASQPRDAKGRFTKKTPDSSGPSAAAPAQDKAKASSASQPRDEKGRFTKKSDQSGPSAAAPKAKGAATTGLGNSQGDQPKSMSGGNKASADTKAGADTKRKTTSGWLSKATKAVTGRPASQTPATPAR